MLNLRPHKLQVKRTIGGGYDENGNPIPVEYFWDGINGLVSFLVTETGEYLVLEDEGFIDLETDKFDFTPCHYETNSRQELLRYNDGAFKVFDYAVWIDPISEDLTLQFVRLIDQYGNIEVEEKEVQKCVNRQNTTKLYL